MEAAAFELVPVEVVLPEAVSGSRVPAKTDQLVRIEEVPGHVPEVERIRPEIETWAVE